MAGCSGCKHSATWKGTKATPVAPANETPLIVGKSETDGKVRVRYYGGGLKRQTRGCMSCGTRGKYSLTTSETIQFMSDDAPNGWFSHNFTVSEDVYVTPKQAERLLQETFTNAAGQVIPKFKVIEQVNLLCYTRPMTTLNGLVAVLLDIWGISLFWDVNRVWCICMMVHFALILLQAYQELKAEKKKEE